MPIRISNLRLSLEEPEEALPAHFSRILGCAATDLSQWRILRKSLDARDKNSLQFVYSVEVSLPGNEEKILQRFQSGQGRPIQVENYNATPLEFPPPGTERLAHRPVIVGSGPAGLVAGYFLARLGYLPIVLERGKSVRERIRDVHDFDAGGPLNPESNYLFGEGGAGTFSDGKLTCRNTGSLVQQVLQLFAECKGKPSILYDYRPHLGSNRLPAVVKAIRRKIEAFGGEVRFSCKVEDLEMADGRLRGVYTSSGFIPAEVVLLAIGHSARDTYAMLFNRKVPMVQKPFQMGVRIEQPQELINRVQYGPQPWEEKLGAADYSLVAHGKNDLFTFCMCAGGNVIPSVSEPGFFCTNGMSLSKRDTPFANSGLVVTVPVEEFGASDILAGVRLQQHFEQLAYQLSGEEYRCPIQWASDFLENKPTTSNPPSSYSRGLVLAEMASLLPPLVLEAVRHGLPIMDKRWRGKFLSQATLVGPEARGSSPVRIVRDAKTRESPGISGLYPVGEGAGYAGGIISAAVDGLRTALAISARFSPLKK